MATFTAVSQKVVVVGVILEHSVSLDYIPHKHVDVVKLHDDLVVAFRRNGSNVAHVP